MRVSSRTRGLLCVFACAMAQAATPAASIRVSPSTADVRVGETKAFSAASTGVTTVSWQVLSTANAPAGSLGSVSGSGVYTPPAALPVPNTVYVRASDSKNAATFGQATVTLLNPAPSIHSLAPAAVNTGLPYLVTITGTNFLPTSQVQWNGAAVVSQFVSPTQIKLAGTTALAANTKVLVTVMNPDPGSKTSNSQTLTVEPPVQVTLAPDKRTVRCGLTLQLTAHVVNNADQTVSWTASAGAVDSKGLYTAPAVLPTSADVTIAAVSKADPSAKATVTASLQNPMPVIGSVTPAGLLVGPNELTIAGAGFARGAKIMIAGQSVPATWISDQKLTASATVAAQLGRIASVKVMNPDPGTLTSAALSVSVKVATEKMAYADAIRFLEMASWGPSPASVAHLQSIGRDAWLAEQFAAPGSPLPNPTDQNEGNGALQQAFLTNALTANDQLRQRVAFALSEIFVVSGVKDDRYWEMVPYLRLLSDNAFGSYRNLLEKITLNPGMGLFLDMVNNDKANPAKNTVANENYGREVMQLFTIGINPLNPDGTLAPGAPAYDQQTVTELAKAFTGWTYPPEPGFQSQWRNPPYFFGEMIPIAEHHDTTQKNLNFAGQCSAIPAGGTAASDLKTALDCLARHPNVAPFISYRLIQRLVMSSPSPQYVGRVAAVFTANAGSLQKVVTAILTDTEALATGSGKLREPVVYSTSLLRALNAGILNNAASGVAGQTEAMGQKLLFPASVFNYFSPFYRIPGMSPPPVAPEFQIMNAATALARVNFVYRAINNQISGNVKVDFSSLEDLAADTDILVEAINQALYRGEMNAAEKTAVKTAAQAAPDPHNRVRNALYVAASAAQYQVEN